MQINSSELKSNAKVIIKESKPNVILISLLYICILMVLQYLSTSLLTGNVTDSAARKYMNMLENGNFDGAIVFAETLMPSRANSILNLIIRIVEWILAAGFIIFIMNTVRNTGLACAGNLLDGFGLFLRVIVLHILMIIVVTLLSCLLVFPGIIAAYSYRQAIYLLVECPEKSPVQCLKESRRLMRGHKWELFCIDFSFIGWFVLKLIVSPVSLWVTPYTNTTWMLYYNYLKSQQYYSEC